jgi:hypothetical protein
MRKRKFFWLSLALAVVAIGLRNWAMTDLGRVATTRALTLTLSEPERAAAIEQARKHVRRGQVIDCAGLACALASVGLLIASARKHEPARRSVLIVLVLLVLYLMLALVLV